MYETRWEEKLMTSNKQARSFWPPHPFCQTGKSGRRREKKKKEKRGKESKLLGVSTALQRERKTRPEKINRRFNALWVGGTLSRAFEGSILTKTHMPKKLAGERGGGRKA